MEETRDQWNDCEVAYVVNSNQPLDYPVQEVTVPCCVCGKEIQPEQLYVPQGPRHLGCKAM